MIIVGRLTLQVVAILLAAVLLAEGYRRLHGEDDHYRIEHWSIKEVGPISAMNNMSDWLILDARREDAYMKGHIDGAMLFGEYNWDEQLGIFLQLWKPEKPILIYCDGQQCDASKRMALRLLKDLPDIKVFVLEGGYPAWVSSQLESISGENNGIL